MSRVTIVGAGLVGSYLAVLLAERGHAVEVYDRGPDPRLTDGGSGRSINITLAHRGLVALDRAGMGAEVRRLAIPALGRSVHSEAGEVVFQPYGSRGEAIHSISRHHLHCALVDFAERRGDIAFRFGHKCLGVDLERPAVRLRERGSGALRTVACDRLLGCDGAFSAVRRRLQRLSRFDYAQQFLDQGYKELTAPAERCRDLDRNAIHVWPRGGYMLIGFANLDGSFTLALHLPFEGEPSFASLSDEAALREFFVRRFPDAVGLVPRLAQDYFERPISYMVTIRCAPWSYRGRVALFGDAAHAIVPSYGQGANSSFEDCLLFARRLDERRGDWEAALADYERQRKPDADAIAELSLDHFAELRRHLGDPRFLLRKAVERALAEVAPERFLSLYSRVSFTADSYVEALAAERRQRALVDRLLEVDGVAAAVAAGRAETLIAELLPVLEGDPSDGEIRSRTGGAASGRRPTPSSAAH